MKYFIKLYNEEKLEISKEEYIRYTELGIDKVLAKMPNCNGTIKVLSYNIIFAYEIELGGK